jgi:hypothetical protein
VLVVRDRRGKRQKARTQRAICGLTRALIRMADERERVNTYHAERPCRARRQVKGEKEGHRRGGSSETPKAETKEKVLGTIARWWLSKTPRREEE